jgi:hypothetical protein
MTRVQLVEAVKGQRELISARLVALSDPIPISGCYLWRGASNPRGYGKFTVHAHSKHFSVLAHRIAYLVFVGDVPDGMFVMHTCDTPSCINPKHLVIGTPSDNVQDKVRKKRHRVGSAAPFAKLTELQALEIRRLASEPNANRSAIARQYGVSHTVVHLIQRGKKWRHLCVH